MNVLDRLKTDFPTIKFKQSDRFQWAPEDKTIYYAPHGKNSDWSLLHEAGHMLCKHKNYSNDLGLLRMEVEAWEEARKLAEKYDNEIDEDHIDKCLDTYRDWIHKRSACPNCTQAGIEKTTGNYQCINCGHQWKVSNERFCRTYRKSLSLSR